MYYLLPRRPQLVSGPLKPLGKISTALAVAKTLDGAPMRLAFALRSSHLNFPTTRLLTNTGCTIATASPSVAARPATSTAAPRRHWISPSSTKYLELHKHFNGDDVLQAALHKYQQSSSVQARMEVVRDVATNSSPWVAEFMVYAARSALRKKGGKTDIPTAERSSHDALTSLIFDSLAAKLADMEADELIGTLNCLAASAPEGAEVGREWSDHTLSLVESAAAQLESSSTIQSHGMRSMCKLLSAVVRACPTATPPSVPAPLPATVVRYASALLANFFGRIDRIHATGEDVDVNNDLADLTIWEFADFAEACACVYPHFNGPLTTRDIVARLDWVAGVQSRWFGHCTSRNDWALVVQILGAFGALQLHGAPASAATTPARTLERAAESLRQLSTPREQAYALATLAALPPSHRSPAVTEGLLVAADEKLRDILARGIEQYHLHLQFQPSAVPGCIFGEDWWKNMEESPRLTFASIVSILDSHARLGYAPDPIILHALLPALRHNPLSLANLELARRCSREVAAFLELLVTFDYSPGQLVLEEMLEMVVEGSKRGEEELLAKAYAAVDSLLMQRSMSVCY